MSASQQPFDIAAPCHRAIRHVLIVDDTLLHRRTLSNSLKVWGFLVSEAGRGQDALKICRANPPDLVLCGWTIADMDGSDFCRKFRALPRDGYGYFVFLTSGRDKAEIAQGMAAGADDFLARPVDTGELQARIATGERVLRMDRELTEKNRFVNVTLAELRGLYHALDRDLVEAKKLQQSLIRERHREFGVAAVSMLLHPRGHVGGDLVGLFQASPTRIGLYGIDVSGHGLSSALMTARLAGYLSAFYPDQNIALDRAADGTHQPRPPAETIAALNHMFFSDMETEQYFTLLMADVDLETGRVVMAQAGHPYPLLQRAGGAVEFIGPGGLPVGLVEGAEYQQFEIMLRPGDRLMIHSDGMLECADPTGRLLEADGLSDILYDLRQTRGLACLESLVWKLAAHAGDNDLSDDVSAVLLEFSPDRPIR